MKRSAASSRRDAGLARLRTVTGWVTAGSIGLLGALSAVVAESLPGRANATPYTGASATTSTTTAPSSSATSGVTAPAGTLPQGTVAPTTVPTLQPPQTVPTPITFTPVRRVRSGGS